MGKMSLSFQSLSSENKTIDKKSIQLGKDKETISFCFFSFSFISASGLRLNKEIVKYSGLNIYV